MTAQTQAQRNASYRARQRAKIERYEAALQSIARDFPSGCDWELQARGCQVVARLVLDMK